MPAVRPPGRARRARGNPMGGGAAAYVAVNDAILSAPEAAYDYAVATWTLDPDEIDSGRTVKPKPRATTGSTGSLKNR